MGSARVILLGASNVVRQPWIFLDTAQRVLRTDRLEVLGAYGHGRSFGMRSRFLARSVPGILDCGLWKAWDERPEAPTYALVTDIGNDIPYGADAATVAGWVEECVRRLSERGARIAMTGLPLVSLRRFPDWQIRLARQLFFPLSTLAAADIWRQVDELEKRLREIPSRWDVAWVEQEGDWYGLDPIHIRRSKVPEACARILSSWKGSELEAPANRSSWHWLRLRQILPESWCWLGLELGRRRSVGTRVEAMRVWLF